MIVTTTVIVFATGIVLLFLGPARRGTWVLAHKASFIVWLAFTAVHVLSHLPAMPAALRAAHPGAAPLERPAGDTGRWIALAGAVVGGAVLAIVLMPHFGVWTARGALAHHHHHLG